MGCVVEGGGGCVLATTYISSSTQWQYTSGARCEYLIRAAKITNSQRKMRRTSVHGRSGVLYVAIK